MTQPFPPKHEAILAEVAGLREQLRRTQAELERARAESRHDWLTGLANRRAFEERLVESLARRRRHGERCVLVLVDLDRFKWVNDTFGHAAGDAVLTAIGRAMRGACRASDHVARIGGEEFAVVLSHTGLDACHAAIERYRRTIAQAAPAVEGRRTQLTASAGAAEPAEGESLESWRRRADEALYAAKAAGGDRLVLATSSRV